MTKGINYITTNLEQNGANLINGLFKAFHENEIANYQESNGYHAKETHSYFPYSRRRNHDRYR